MEFTIAADLPLPYDEAVRAVRAGLADAGVEAGQVGWINAHGTGTQFNDKCEAAACVDVFDGLSAATAGSPHSATPRIRKITRQRT